MEVVSALQKAIRRCDEHLALWWAREILSVGWHKYLWGRLAIIAIEDVGEPNALTWVEIGRQAFYREAEYRAARGTDNPFDVQGAAACFLYRVVSNLARATKDRTADEFMCWATEIADKLPSERPEIPDYAFDNHTKKGRAMGRDEAQFYEEAGTVKNQHPAWNSRYKDALLALHLKARAAKAAHT